MSCPHCRGGTIDVLRWSEIALGQSPGDFFLNTTALTSTAQIHQEFRQQAEADELQARQEEKNADEENGALANRMSVQPAYAKNDHEGEAEEFTGQPQQTKEM